MITLGPYALLAILELFLLFTVATILLAVRGARLSRALATARRANHEEPAVDAGPGLDAYLRDEVVKTKGLMDTHDEGGAPPQWLRARQLFLELELEAVALSKNPEAVQGRLREGFAALLEEFRPEPQIIEQTVEVAAEPDVEPEQTAAPESGEDNEDEERRKQVARLRDIIGNQQKAMRNLRGELESREGEIADLEKIVDQLERFEAQTAELVRCIEVLERENERLKAAREAGETDALGTDPEELKQLREMVDRQQGTISGLQTMIEELTPEAGKAQELEDMVNDVLKSNQELNTCVLVLEDENKDLRNQLETVKRAAEAEGANVEMAAELAELKKQLQELDSLITFKDATIQQLETELEQSQSAPAAEDGEPAKPSAQVEELQIRVQELEALVEFKDAAVEELEKQYAELEHKYLALTGEEKQA